MQKWGRGEERARKREGEREQRKGETSKSAQPPAPLPAAAALRAEVDAPPSPEPQPAGLNLSYLVPRSGEAGDRGAPQRLPMQPASPKEGPRRGPPPRAGRGPFPQRRRRGGSAVSGPRPDAGGEPRPPAEPRAGPGSPGARAPARPAAPPGGRSAARSPGPAARPRYGGPRGSKRGAELGAGGRRRETGRRGGLAEGSWRAAAVRGGGWVRRSVRVRAGNWGKLVSHPRDKREPGEARAWGDPLCRARRPSGPSVVSPYLEGVCCGWGCRPGRSAPRTPGPAVSGLAPQPACADRSPLGSDRAGGCGAPGWERGLRVSDCARVLWDSRVGLGSQDCCDTRGISGPS